MPLLEKNIRTKSRVKVDYDEASGSYDRIRFGTEGGRYADRAEKNLLARVVKGENALEIGTATGRFAILLVQRGYEYTGIDLSLAMLRVTSSRTKFDGGKTSFLQMDAEQMAFRPYFDNVICIRTFHFLPHPHKAMQDMVNSMKQRGRCLVTFETDNPLRRFAVTFDLGGSKQRYYKRKEVEDLFRASGLTVIESGAVLRLPVTLYRRCPKSLIGILERLDHFWPWPTHEYVLGEAPVTARGPC